MLLQDDTIMLVGEESEGLKRYDYVIISKSDFAAVGLASLRLHGELSEEYNGNIGYEIHEAFQGNGYAERAARLLVNRAAEKDMQEVMICCDASNAASRHIIEKMGGVYKDTVAVPKDYTYYKEGIEPRHRFILSAICRK